MSTEFSRKDMAKALRREIALRIHVYAKRVKNGSMKVEEAERETDVMRAILREIERAD